MSEIGNFFRAVRDDVLSKHDEEVFSEGFDTAAGLALGVLRDNIDQLRKEIKSGLEGVNEKRALLLVELTELKDELEKRLREYGEHADVK
ncbi:hypothetical protein [Diaminobutyricibacter sp. McL0608]|uniref:hypothetical protein n=1 Tax=Leifsonia sp. McL0608 TaxID=3143537 RepID=UPI0031F30655